MKIKPITFQCEGCGKIGDSPESIKHVENCPVISDMVWEKKKELLSGWLCLELPDESMEVCGWKGTNNIAHNLLLYMKNEPLFNVLAKKGGSLEEI